MKNFISFVALHEFVIVKIRKKSCPSHTMRAALAYPICICYFFLWNFCSLSGSLTNARNSMPSSIIGIRPRIPYCVSPVIIIIVDTAIGPKIAENLENTEKMRSIKRTLPFWICLWIYAAMEKKREWQNGFRKRENYVRKSNFKKILLIWRKFWKKERKICRKTQRVMYRVEEKEVQKAA